MSKCTSTLETYVLQDLSLEKCKKKLMCKVSRYKINMICTVSPGFPGGSVVKNLPVNVGDVGLNPESGRSPGEGNGNPL